MKRPLAACVLAAALAGPLPAQPAPGELVRSRDADFRIEEVAAGLGVPWGIAFLPGGDILFTERAGQVRLIRGGKLQPAPVEGVPAVWANGQGGLLDIAAHPKFAENRLIYLAYSLPDATGDNAITAVARAKFDGVRLAETRMIFRPPDAAFGSAGVHFGTRIVFDREGRLYFSIGDRGQQARAQDLGAFNGKIYRLEYDGRIPPDNPFVGRAGAIPAIWSYGHRNPQGLAFHPETGELWSAEHGPKGGDEINVIAKGLNFGWPEITYGVNYNGTPITDLTQKEGMEQPRHFYVPSIATCGIAFGPGGMFPKWRGDLFVASLKFGYVDRLRIGPDGKARPEEKLLEGTKRVRHVAFAPDGSLYVLLENPGRIWRLTAAAAGAPGP